MKLKELNYEEIMHHKAQMIKELCHDVNNKIQALLLPLEVIQHSKAKQGPDEIKKNLDQTFLKVCELSKIIECFSLIHYPSVTYEEYSPIPVSQLFGVLTPIIKRKCAKYKIDYDLKIEGDKIRGTYHEMAQIFYMLQKWSLNQLDHVKGEKKYLLSAEKIDQEMVFTQTSAPYSREDILCLERNDKNIKNSWFRLVKYLVQKNRGVIGISYKEKQLIFKIKFKNYE